MSDSKADSPELGSAPLTRQWASPAGPQTRQFGGPAGAVDQGSVAPLTREYSTPSGPETRVPQINDDGGGRGTGGFISRNLPPDLAVLFTPNRELESGGQAAVLLCERIAEPHDRVAIKLYNTPVAPAVEDPRAQLRTIPTDFAVGYVDPYFGTADGRWWEVHEYLELGSVRDYASPKGGRLEQDQLDELLRGMVDALDHLHHRNPKIIHRDIKPANILLRSVNPMRAVLADFGVAILTDSTMTMRTSARTEAYASPEAAAGDTRPAWDWWSLGMTMAELAAGRHPYQMEDGRFLQQSTIQSALATTPVPLHHIEDPRLLLLLRGLLTKDPEQRWDATQVRTWLEGGNPALGTEWTVPRMASRPDTAILRFMGAEYTDPAALARAITQDWRQAGKRLAGRDLDRLVDWVDDVAPDSSIRGLVSTYETARRGTPDPVVGNLNLLIAKIVTRLDPGGDPSFMGEPMTLTSLSGWAARFGRGESGELRDVLDQLFHTAALDEYRRMPGHGSLEDVQRQWEDLSLQAVDYFAQVPQAGDVTPEMRAVCLRIAVARVMAEVHQ